MVLGLVVSEKMFNVFISKIYFSLCDLDMQLSLTIQTIIKEDHISTNPTKFCKNPASLLKQLLTTHDGRRTSNDHNSSP